MTLAQRPHIRSLFLFAFCLMALPAMAQWSKARPVIIKDAHQRLGYYSLEGDGDEEVLIRSKMSKPQAASASTYLHYTKYPKGLSDKGNVAEIVAKYKAYVVADWVRYNQGRALVWVPRDENLHMPADLQPIDDNGFFMVFKGNETGFSYLAGKPESASAHLGPVRFGGTLAIAYGPPDGSVANYYLYEVYCRGMIDGDELLKNLKKETPDQRYKKHKFYIGQTYAPVIKAFKQELSRKEAKHADWIYGGNTNEVGYSQFALLHPQHPQHELSHSTADMSQFLPRSSVVVNDPAITPEQRPKTVYRKCYDCSGAGYIKTTKTSYSHSGGVGTVGSTGYVDWQTAPSSTKRTSTDYVRCNACHGTGQVER